MLFALIEAEEYGITQANVDELKASSKDPACSASSARRGHRQAAGPRQGLGVPDVKAVGNYGEIFERNVGPKTPLELPRGLNNLWNKGGLMYAPPIR